MSVKSIISSDDITPIRNRVFVVDMDGMGSQITRGGIILPSDNGNERGIRPRWGKVWKVGPDVTEVTPGEWVLVSHGRWTERIMLTREDGTSFPMWMIEFPDSVLLVSDQKLSENADHTF